MTLKVDGTNGVLQAYDYQVLTTGFSYTFAAGVQLLLAVPAGTLATGTVTMPASPVDGMNITITSTQQITALTVNANTGQSIVGGATTLAAGGSQTFVYRLSNTTWYSQNNNATTLPGTQAQLFTSTGTFTVPAGVTAIKVTVIGGGGGTGNSTVNNSKSGGGGGGGTAISYLTGLTPGATIAVTVGLGGGVSTAGGTSSFGAYCSATGGSGTATNAYAGSNGGSASGGTFNFQGSRGSDGYSGFIGCSSAQFGGNGGVCGGPAVAGNTSGWFTVQGILGGLPGATVGVSSGSINGLAGSGYGNGAGGSARMSSGTGLGASGSAGAVLVEW